MVEDAGQVARLLLGEHVPVAVVVVPGVVVVEPRHPPALELRVPVLAVPARLQDLTVGVQRGHQQQDHAVQPPLGLGVLGGGQRVGPLHRHLARPDLGRVDVAGDHHDDLALADEALLFGRVQPARVGQPPGRRLPAIPLAQVRLRGDHRHQHVLAQRGLAQHLDQHPRLTRPPGGGSRQRSAVVGQLLVGPDRETQEGRGRLDLRRRRLRRRGERAADDHRRQRRAEREGAPRVRSTSAT